MQVMRENVNLIQSFFYYQVNITQVGCWQMILQMKNVMASKIQKTITMLTRTKI